LLLLAVPVFVALVQRLCLDFAMGKQLALLVIFLSVSVVCRANNLVMTNPGAETGDLSGWSAIWISYGAVRSSVPDATAAVNPNPALSSMGSDSFILNDESLERSVGIRYATRIPISSREDYQLSFDGRILSGNIDPWAAIDFWSAPENGFPVVFIAPGFDGKDGVSAVTPAANGFKHYTVSIRPKLWQSPNAPLLPNPLYLDLTFYDEFYDSAKGSVAIDNISVREVAEPSSLALLVLGIASCATIIRSENCRKGAK
jgi:hypothetical protein